jgi:hypothetical protein
LHTGAGIRKALNNHLTHKAILSKLLPQKALSYQYLKEMEHPNCLSLSDIIFSTVKSRFAPVVENVNKA